jgi:hypothetical protein
LIIDDYAYIARSLTRSLSLDGLVELFFFSFCVEYVVRGAKLSSRLDSESKYRSYNSQL